MHYHVLVGSYRLYTLNNRALIATIFMIDLTESNPNSFPLAFINIFLYHDYYRLELQYFMIVCFSYCGQAGMKLYEIPSI